MRPTPILLACVTLAWGCSSGTPSTTTPTPVATMTISTGTATLVAGTTLQLAATTKDASGSILTGRTITWASTASTVATVSTNGLVTAIAAGTATISATSEGQSASATVTVTPTAVPVASVTLSPAAGTLGTTGTLQLTATPKDSVGNTLAGRAITWTTSASGIATVTATGLVTAIAVGTATVTATSEGRAASATITVVAGTVIGAAGGTVTSPDGKASVVIPAGALAQATPIWITPAVGAPVDGYVMPDASYDFQPTGTQFAQPVTITVTYNPASILAGNSQGTVQMYVATGDAWVPIAGSTVDTIAHRVSGNVSHFTPHGAGDGPIGFRRTDYSAGDQALGAYANLNLPGVRVCVGGKTSTTVSSWPPNVASGPSSYGVAPSSIAAAVATSTGGILPDPGFEITGLAVGQAILTATFTVFNFGTNKNEAQAALLVINVVNCPGNNSTVPITYSAHLSSNCDNAYILPGAGVALPVTTNCFGRYPMVGEAAGISTVFGCRCVSGANPEIAAWWAGINGSGTTILLPTPMPAFGGFITPNATGAPGTPPGYLAYPAPGAGGTSDFWVVPFNSNSATQLTRLGGTVGSLAVSPDAARIIFPFTPVNVIGMPHLFSLPLPAIGGPPVTSGQVQLTTGSQAENRPAISQNGALLAYEQQDALLGHSQLFVQSLRAPTSSPIPITPPTGFAFSPSWCGNEFVYYVYSTSIGGTYQVMRWSPILNVSTAVPAFAGANVYDISVARTEGDGGLHICP